MYLFVMLLLFFIYLKTWCFVWSIDYFAYAYGGPMHMVVGYGKRINVISKGLAANY